MERFHGEWSYLAKSIYEGPELRADRALLEMAVQLRVLLDDAKDSTPALSIQLGGPLGVLSLRNGNTKDLTLRQMANKIIHGEHFEWILDGPNDPRIVIRAPSAEDWSEAEIHLVALMAHIGGLAF